MTTAPVSQNPAWVRLRTVLEHSVHPPAMPNTGGSASLRLGVERGMAATLAIVALLLVLLALPDFGADHRPEKFPLTVAAWSLAGLMIAALPLALIQRTNPVRAGLWVPVIAYIALLILEPFILRDPLPAGSTPWLLGLSLIAFSCTAVAEPRPLRAVVICAGINTALACVYAGRFPLSHTLVDVTGLGLLSAVLIAGVRALRLRADNADAHEQRTQRSFEAHQQQVATEAERVHTDALLHDTVLATLLAAAGNHTPERATSMARAALEFVTDMSDHPDLQPATIPFRQAVSSAEKQLTPFRELVSIDFTNVLDVDVSPDVADAVISATLQAVTNSINHAGASANRTVAAFRVAGDGIRVTISDDGVGCNLADIASERLGVRVSIVERLRLVGGHATLKSSPGNGTTVTLEWHPSTDASPPPGAAGEMLLNLIPRKQLYRVLGAVIVMAVVIASTEALLVTHAYGSVLASLLGLVMLPALLRGARLGRMSNRSAWAITAGSCLLCFIATIGLDAATFDCVSVARYTCGVLAGAVMLWMAGHKAPPIIAVAVLLIQITLWAGPTGAIRLGLAAEIVIVIAGLLMHRTLEHVTVAAEAAAKEHRALTARQAEIDAFHLERQRRLRHASSTAAPMLTQIIHARGVLNDDSRTECHVLEQALRDEIRGRRLLNDAIRETVSTHRRRGALVQVLDDGGLDGIGPDTLDTLLDDVAHQLERVRSTRIIIRTGQPDTDTAITIVASTPDETAAALGLDADDEVDLWLNIPRPANPHHTALASTR